uniref:Uncharacterized protein n=1 Tax=Chenopodium quinoa TaxID=63459 RepID=A0A803L777_CHEQI
MGRGKIEIKRIENATNRQVTFSKRRNGIIKKAKEITVLCDAKVSVVIFANNNGKMYDYHSPSTTVEHILDKYQEISGVKLWDAKHENLKNEIDRVKKENDDMRIELRHLNGEDIASLQYPDLIRLEEALDIGIARINDRKAMYCILVHTQNKQENEMIDGGVRHAPQERDYHYQIPYGYRLQPMQPNLQERM